LAKPKENAILRVVIDPLFLYNTIMEDHEVNDLYEDMERLNALYEELMWDHDAPLDMRADYKNNRIIITLKK